jgi:MFS family permease
VGPIVGPTLGSWLIVNFSWRWVFYINAPVGARRFPGLLRLLEDPDYLRQERAELKKAATSAARGRGYIKTCHSPYLAGPPLDGTIARSNVNRLRIGLASRRS